MKKLILSLALVGSVYSFGQLDRSVRPTAAEAPVINIANPATFELANGIKVIVSENHKQPKVAFNLVMGGDPLLEGEKAGVSSMVSDLIMSGTSNRSKDEIDSEKDYIGAYLSASSSNVYLSCLTKHMDKGLELMLDITNNASFPESEFDRVKKLYESALLSAQSSPGEMAGNAKSKALFPENHPYGEIMTEESLNNITREDVVSFYKASFTPAQAYLVIVGDIDVENAKKIAEEKFGKWQGDAPFKADYNKGFFPKGNRVIFVEKPGAVQSVITIAQPVKMMPGDADQIKLSVMNKILGGGGFGTRLMQNLREDKAYTYGAYSSLDVDRLGSYLSASGNFRNDVTDSAIVQFLYEFDRITKGEVTDEELELNKMSMQGSFARSLESPQTIARFALSTYRNNLPADYYQTYLKKLKAVSKDDVLAVAKKYITPNSLNIIVVGNPDVLESIKKFDADGKIEMFDAFGNPAVKVEMLATDITKDQLVANSLMAIAKTETLEAAKAKFETVESLEIKSDVSMANVPMTFSKVDISAKGGKMISSFSGQGMVFQKEVFNGKKGLKMELGQGGPVETPYTDEEVKEANERFNVMQLDELNFLNGSLDFEILGMMVNGDDKHIVVKYTKDGDEVKAFYNADNFIKEKTVALTKQGEDVIEVVTTYKNNEEVEGFVMAKEVQTAAGPQVFTFKVKEVNVNGEVDNSVFKL